MADEPGPSSRARLLAGLDPSESYNKNPTNKISYVVPRIISH